MEIKTVEDVVKIHEEFALRVQKMAETLSAGRPSEVLAAEKMEQINLFRGKLKEITATRDEALRRYDEEISRLRETVSRLEEEIKGGGKGPARSRPGTGRDSNGPRKGSRSGARNRDNLPDGQGLCHGAIVI